MEDAEWLAERFEAARPRLQRIAQRIMGSAAESADALQETWLRIHCETDREPRAGVGLVCPTCGAVWPTVVHGRELQLVALEVPQ